MVLELARLRALDGPVTRVVDAGRELVRKQRTVVLEQLYGEHSDVVETVEQLRRDQCAGRLQRGRELRRRRAADAQDSADVLVLHERIAARVPIEPAHRQHRELAVEGDESL